MPTYGIYEGINTDAGSSTWLPRLQAIASGGFNVVLNYNLLYGHIWDIQNYINQAHALGMQVIVALHHPSIWLTNTYATNFPELYADSGHAATGALFAAYVVKQVVNLAGTWGYYVGDERTIANHTLLQPYAASIRNTDSTHPRLYICDGLQTTNATYNGTTIYTDVSEYLGDDYYPINGPVSGPTGPTVYNASDFTTHQTGIKTNTTTWGLHSATVIQAFNNSDTIPNSPWPSNGQMLAMRNNAVSAGIELILCYNYFDIASGHLSCPPWQWAQTYTAIAQGVQTAVAGIA